MLEVAAIIALTVLFIHATTWEGMINEWVSRVFWEAPDWVKKPLYDCPICMAPWWGLYIYTIGGLTGSFEYFNWYQVAIMLCMAGGINAVLIYIISYAKDRPETEDGAASAE